MRAGAVIVAAGGDPRKLARAASPDNLGSAYQLISVEEVLESTTSGFEDAIEVCAPCIPIAAEPPGMAFIAMLQRRARLEGSIRRQR